MYPSLDPARKWNSSLATQQFPSTCQFTSFVPVNRTDPIMSRSPLSSYSIINTWNKLIRFQHHHRFLSRCQQLNSIPQGLRLNFKLALGSSDEILKQRCEHLFAASINILSDLVNFADTATRQLQQQLEEKRKLLSEHHDHGTALDSWNSAKRSTTSLNRSLSLRYRHEIEKVFTPAVYQHTEQLHEENARKPKHKNRRFSKKVRIDRKLRFFSSARMVTSRLCNEKFFPMSLSLRELDPDEKSLLSKGPSFCPVARDNNIDRLKLQEDWERFKNRLRAATFFFNNRGINSSPTEEEREPIFPTVKKVSSGKAPVSKFPEVELFLE